jgi:hypothetical protein
MTISLRAPARVLAPALFTFFVAACGDGGGGSDAAVLPDAPLPPPSCETYCTTLMANCTAEAAQYGSMDACLGACAGLTLGAASDSDGNTVGCRTYHANSVPTAGVEHCDHAGPMGADECGSNCEGFCAIAVHTCTGANQVWATEAACMTDCAMMNDTVGYNATVQTGDSLACRMYHLTMASEPGSAEHCDHIGLASPVCN